MRFLLFVVIFSWAINSGASAAEWGMKSGNPHWTSAGALAFGPSGVLFLADPKGASILAVDTGDTARGTTEANIQIDAIDGALSKLLQQEKVTIQDMAVNPQSGTIYLSVSAGEKELPSLVRVLPQGKLESVSLQQVKFSQVQIPNPPADQEVGDGRRNRRKESITDMAFSEGRLLVSGVSGDASGNSKVLEFLFPFNSTDHGANIEIYHAAHGKYENNAAVRTFVPFTINGEPHLLAGFTCTPLVKFPLSDLEQKETVKGTTIAELGNRNQPLDMIVYAKEGREFVLMSNSVRGVMKISTESIERQDGLTEPVRGGGTAGQPFETIQGMQGVVQLDRLNDTQAVVVIRDEAGVHSLKTVSLP